MFESSDDDVSGKGMDNTAGNVMFGNRFYVTFVHSDTGVVSAVSHSDQIRFVRCHTFEL